MVVVVIIGIVMSIAVVRYAGFGDSRAVEEAASLLTSTIKAVSAQAILQPAVIGMRFDGNQYHLYALQARDRVSGNWVLMRNSRLVSPVPWSSRLNVMVKSLGRFPSVLANTVLHPQLVFLPDGSVTPARILIETRSHTHQIRLVVLQNGVVKQEGS